VVGEGHEWEGVLPRFTEEESEGVETRGGAAFVETTEADLERFWAKTFGAMREVKRESWVSMI